MLKTTVSISGPEKEHFAKWLLGWREGGGLCCADIPEEIWSSIRTCKPAGCSWQACGQLMAMLRLAYIDVDIVIRRHGCDEDKH